MLVWAFLLFDSPLCHNHSTIGLICKKENEFNIATDLLSYFFWKRKSMIFIDIYMWLIFWYHGSKLSSGFIHSFWMCFCVENPYFVISILSRVVDGYFHM